MRYHTETIDNTKDLIDSRDVSRRIDELDDEREAYDDVATGDEDWETDNEDDAKELAALIRFRDDANTSEWKSGVTFVRDSHFTDYAEQLADDIGAIDSNAKWPLNHIDWDAAADELKTDYSSVEFDGVTYWYQG